MTNTAGAAKSGERWGADAPRSSVTCGCAEPFRCSTLVAVTRASVIASLLLFVGLAVPSAQAAPQRTDPDATSPAGVIYEIPFDSARSDAAPKVSSKKTDGSSNAAGSTGSGGSGGGTSGTGGSGSSGSGSSGSGATSGTGGSGSSGSGSGTSAGGSGGTGGSGATSSTDPNVGTSIHSENGFGSSSVVPGTVASLGPVATDGPPSSAVHASGGGNAGTPVATFGLLGLVAIVGGWIGIGASRGLRLQP
jgi:hypothetical protein